MDNTARNQATLACKNCTRSAHSTDIEKNRIKITRAKGKEACAIHQVIDSILSFIAQNRAKGIHETATQRVALACEYYTRGVNCNDLAEKRSAKRSNKQKDGALQRVLELQA